MTRYQRRQRLQNRRHCEIFGFRWQGLDYTATIGRFSDGRLAEIFLAGDKLNSDCDAIARDGGGVASIALQFGADVETLRGPPLRDSRGAAASPLGAALDRIADAGIRGSAP
jgi:hypothetical protein